jgi:hypothetical protein
MFRGQYSLGLGDQQLQRPTRLDAAWVRVPIGCVFVRIVTKKPSGQFLGLIVMSH